MMPAMVNAANNTESYITGFSARSAGQLSTKVVRHLKVDDATVFGSIYDCGVLIGKGNFGSVYEVTNKRDAGTTWAMKIIPKQPIASPFMKAVEREIKILKLLNHPHIIELHEVLESPKNIYLILEKCHADLWDCMKKRKHFPESMGRHIFRDLISAVAYLHRHDIVHRDIKLENVLVTNNPVDESDHYFVKLTDFGLSIIKTGRGYTDMLHERCGTLGYMAPEILTSQSYSNLCDIWAIGIIMYIVFSGQLPFTGSDDKSLVNNICKFNPSFDVIKASPECTDLIAKVLDKDPANRPTASEAFKHPWIQGQPLSSSKSTNVLEMMRMWNNDLKSNNTEPEVCEVVQTNKGRRQSIPITVRNVSFGNESSRANSRFAMRRAEEKKKELAARAKQQGGVNKKEAPKSAGKRK